MSAGIVPKIEVTGLQAAGKYLQQVQRVVRTKATPRLVALAWELRRKIQEELSITGKGPAAPGSPPRKKTGRLQRSIKFRMDGDMSVLIGSTGRTHGWYGRIHENGAVLKTRLPVLKTFAQGEDGPIEYARNPTRIRLETQAQADRATRINQWLSRRGAQARYYAKRTDINHRQDADMYADGFVPEFETKENARVRFPARPFVGPVIKDNMARIPYAFENLF